MPPNNVPGVTATASCLSSFNLFICSNDHTRVLGAVGTLHQVLSSQVVCCSSLEAEGEEPLIELGIVVGLVSNRSKYTRSL